MKCGQRKRKVNKVNTKVTGQDVDCIILCLTRKDCNLCCKDCELKDSKVCERVNRIIKERNIKDYYDVVFEFGKIMKGEI